MSNRARPGEHLAWLQAATQYSGSDCLRWPFRSVTHSANGGGPYGATRCTGTFMLAHRLILIWTQGDPPPGAESRHSCDVPLCCTPTHLAWGTAVENADDKALRGRTRLTLENVCTIQASSESTAALARQFGVTPKAVRDVRTGRSWRRYLS